MKGYLQYKEKNPKKVKYFLQNTRKKDKIKIGANELTE